MHRIVWLDAALGGVALWAIGFGPGEARSSGRDAPRELGAVRWERDFDAAAARARQEGKPLFVLFQEVPGCSTCVGFGESVLSNPLMVEVIEETFVPVAIFNNAGGADRRVLERFGEPAWNNPVVRFLDADGRDLIPRRAGVWTTLRIAERGAAALAAAGRPVPEFLDWVIEEETGRRRARRITLETHCFWEGEGCIGTEPGVVSTRAGWVGGREVVEVEYDPARLDDRALLAAIRRKGCADRIHPHDARQAELAREIFDQVAPVLARPARSARASDQKFHLRRSPLRNVALTERQQTRVNAAIAQRRSLAPWLSPRQRAALSVAGR